jgi:poly(A) polymerase
MREIWDLQFRLPKRYGKRAFTLLHHPRFRAAFDFLLIREQSGTDLGGLGTWWTEFQEAPDNQQRDLVNQADGRKNEASKAKRRRPRRRKSNAKRPSDSQES